MQIAFADFTEFLLESVNLSAQELGTPISALQTKCRNCMNINSFAKF